ncbi:MAG: ParA family protein [Thermoanaerobaculia bacterium]|nr:ParA family protein [Thermoanaerobaculia bacterium]
MRIISFFSFKGGVGRTALLANLGALWASEGKVVVLVDMDFFAPGLTYLPQGGQPLDPDHWQGGMSDLLDAFVERGWADQNLAFVPPTKLFREMSWPEQGQGTEGGRLLLIDVGTRVSDLLARGFSSRANTDTGALRAFPPREGREAETPEQTVLRALARHIQKDFEDFRFPEGDRSAGKAIDYVLIDSRTGWTELQDLSLGYLAEQMVVVSGLNDQNLRGLELTLEALKKEGRVPVDMFASLLTIVFSPVPAAEDQATLDALDRGHQVIAGALRVTRAGIREKAPLSTAIHYSPSLAISDDLVALARPRALYSQEIRYVSDLLLGKVDTDKDVLIKESRSRTLRIVPLARSAPLEGPSEAVKDLPQRLEIAVNAELPPWWWPLGSDAEAEARLAELAPPNPGVSMDRGVFVTMFCHSISFTASEKQKFFESFPRLSQFQVEETVRLLETEQQKFQQLMVQEPQHHPALLALYFQHQRDWAGLILGSERAGFERFLRAPLEGESLFPAWEKTPVYWQLLAQDLLLRLNDPDAARQALGRTLVPDRDAEAVVSGFLDRLPKEGERPTLPEPAEKLALELAPDSPRVRFMVARSRWRRKEDEDALRTALEPLLAEPPADGDLCYDVLAFVLDEAPRLAPQGEGIARGRSPEPPRNRGLGTAWETCSKTISPATTKQKTPTERPSKSIPSSPFLGTAWETCSKTISPTTTKQKAPTERPSKSTPNTLTLGTAWVCSCETTTETLWKPIGVFSTASKSNPKTPT